MNKIELYNTITAPWFYSHSEENEGSLFILGIINKKEAVIHMTIAQPTTAQIFTLSAHNQLNLISENV